MFQNFKHENRAKSKRNGDSLFSPWIHYLLCAKLWGDVFNSTVGKAKKIGNAKTFPCEVKKHFGKAMCRNTFYVEK